MHTLKDMLNEVEWEKIPKQRTGPTRVIIEAVNMANKKDANDKVVFDGEEVGRILTDACMMFSGFLHQTKKKGEIDTTLLLMCTAMVCNGHKIYALMDKDNQEAIRKVMSLARKAGIIDKDTKL